MNRDDILNTVGPRLSRAYAKGIGAPKVLVGATNPAAGSEIPFTDFVVPAGKVWVPLSFSVVCVQGITQTPLVGIAWDDGTNILGVVPGASAAQSVSTTSRWTWARPAPGLITAGAAQPWNFAPMPELELEPGQRIGTQTGGIGANTDFAAAILRYYELSI